MWETIKENKWLVGALVAGVLILALLFGGSGGADSTATASAPVDGTDAANQYNAMLAQVNGAVQQSTIAAGAKADDNQALITIETIRAGVAENANTLAAQVAQFATAKSAEVQTTRDTLSAQVAASNNATQLGIVQSNNLTSSTNIATVANALVENQRTQANAIVQVSANQAQAQVGVAQASRPCDSYFFGLFSNC